MSLPLIRQCRFCVGKRVLDSFIYSRLYTCIVIVILVPFEYKIVFEDYNVQIQVGCIILGCIIFDVFSICSPVLYA